MAHNSSLCKEVMSTAKLKGVSKERLMFGTIVLVLHEPLTSAKYMITHLHHSPDTAMCTRCNDVKCSNLLKCRHLFHPPN